MAKTLTTTAKENLLRLWKSEDSQNHDLAIQMVRGFDLQHEDYLWLWDCYHALKDKEPRYMHLRNLSQLSQKDLLRGKILALLLQGEIAHNFLNTFLKHSILRIPYSSLSFIPSSIYNFPNVIEEIIWQDGEIKSIDSNIIQLQHLKRLDVRRQPIEFIHPNIADLPLLEEIHLISTSFLPDELIDRKDIEIYTDAPY